MTSETFPARVNFSALEAVQQALASVPRVWQIEVWLETTLEEAQEQMRQPKACFEEAQGGVLSTISSGMLRKTGRDRPAGQPA